MRRLVPMTLMALSAAALAPAPGAWAAPSKRNVPAITKVSPMRVSVGGRLVITGRHFKANRSANTVIFRAPSGRTAFAKPRRASRTRLVLTVPAAVSRLLAVSDSRQKPTRLKLRVLAGRFSSYTPRRLSPVITGVGGGDGPPGARGGSAKVCKDDSDHDNDLLSNELEGEMGTDPCLEDTDGDTMSDGWELWSAKDLNIKAVPYPGRRPYPNALDPSDGADGAHRDGFSAFDFDGDGLTSLEEYRAWRVTGGSFIGAKAGGLDLESPLGYSDGTKFSRASEVPAVPSWRGPSYGLAAPTQPFPATYNFHADAPWRDDERDADADGLSNWLESKLGPSRNDWQRGFWAAKPREIKPWKEETYCGTRPGYFAQIPFANLDLANRDVDDDTLLDGEDDQDHDDYTNIRELYEVLIDLDSNGAGGVNPAWCVWAAGAVPTIDRGGTDWPVNAMNPCVPDPGSRTCHDYVPFG